MKYVHNSNFRLDMICLDLIPDAQVKDSLSYQSATKPHVYVRLVKFSRIPLDLRSGNSDVRSAIWTMRSTYNLRGDPSPKMGDLPAWLWLMAHIMMRSCEKPDEEIDKKL